MYKSFLDIGFTTAGFPRWRINFLAKRHPNPKFEKGIERKIGFKFRLGLVAIVEYNDTISIKKSKSVVPLGLYKKGQNVKWSKIQRNNLTSTVTEDEISGSYKAIMLPAKEGGYGDDVEFTKEYLDEKFHVVLDSFLSISEASVGKLNKTVVRPNGLKFGLDIHNFPYKYDNSKLVVVAKVESKAKRQRGEGSKKNSLDIGSKFGRIGWVPEVDLGNNQTANVTLQVVQGDIPELSGRTSEDDNDRDQNETIDLMLFKIDAIQPKHVIWDPELGVNDNVVEEEIENLPAITTDDEEIELDEDEDGDKNAANDSKNLSLFTLSALLCFTLFFLL